MDAFLSGFTDELVKVATKRDRDREMRKAMRVAKKSPNTKGFERESFNPGRSSGKNYLAATALGALAFPLMALGGRRAGRAFHNKAVHRAMKATKSPAKRKALKKQLNKGPWIGSGIPKPKAGQSPLMTTADLGGQAVHGALYGSVIQMLKDRYAGMKPAKGGF
jgi:hypothetical protein